MKTKTGLELESEYLNKMLTPKQITRIQELHKDGKSPREIAKLLDISFNSVRYQVYDKGKKRKGGQKKQDERSKELQRRTSRRKYYRNKNNDWPTWKANALISSFQSRHRKVGRLYTYLTCRKDYAKIIDEKLGGPCEYCGKKLTKDNFSVDHKTPISRAGDTNDENIAYCCGRCNSEKGNLTSKEFNELLALIKTWDDKGKYMLVRLRSAGIMFRK